MKTIKSGWQHVMENKISVTIFSLVLLAWLICWYSLKDLDHTDRGTFGDMFGAVNALFSGLAFAGIVITILLQRQELELQRKELTLTRQEFMEQNATFKQQRFDNTFFNLLTLHKDLVLSLEYNGKVGRKVFQDLVTLNCSRYYNMRAIQLKNHANLVDSYNKENWPGISEHVEHYVESLTAIYALIIEYETESPNNDSAKYFSLMKSFLSRYEQNFLFFHFNLYRDAHTTQPPLESIGHDLGLFVDDSLVKDTSNGVSIMFF
jgi:hypothetical protein